jgi:outer membrane autotransporter protein
VDTAGNAFAITGTGNTLINGIISDGSGTATVLTKNGTGNLALSGANTYRGGTIISGGTLTASNNSALGTGPVTLNTNGILSVKGTVNADSFTWNGGQIALSPKNGDLLAVTGAFNNGGSGGAFILGALNMGLNTLVTFDSTDFTLPIFNNANPSVKYEGVFILNPDSLQIDVLSAQASGPLLQNSSPVNIPIYADFTVQGQVTTGRPTESNTVNSLLFMPGSSLQVFNNLTVTSGNFTVDNGSATVSGGNIITPGDFTKLGGGALSLFSNVLVDGNLNLTGGALTAGSTFHVNGQTNLTGHSSFFINPGAFFSGGPVYVNSGSLLDVNGALQSPFTQILHGGILKGSGVILGDVRNSGTVAPGNSPGTLTLKGNYTQTGSGTLQIQIASKSNFDHLVVSGKAHLSGTLDVQSLDAKLEYGDQFAFLQAGAINGKFSRIEVPDPSVNRGRFVAEGGTGILLIAPTSYTLVVQTPNQARVAKALDHWIGIEDGDIGTVTLALDMLTAPQYAGAFEAIMPGYYGSALNMSTELTHSQLQSLHYQLSSRKLGAEAVQENAAALPASGGKDAKVVAPQVSNPDYAWNTWTQASGLFSEAGVSLSPDRGFESGSFLAGADYAISKSTSVGLFTGYQIGYADHDSDFSKLDLGKFIYGGYASYEEGGFYTHAAVGGGASHYDVRRSILLPTLQRTATAKPDGQEVYAQWGGGYDVHAWRWTVGPNWSVQYDHQSLNGFTEHGADSLDLLVKDGDTDSLRTYVGARAACTFKLAADVAIIPELRASWQHEFMQNGGTLGSALDGGAGPSFDYRTESNDTGRDSLDAGASVGLQWGARFYTNLFYNAEFGRTPAANHTVGVSASWKF